MLLRQRPFAFTSRDRFAGNATSLSLTAIASPALLGGHFMTKITISLKATVAALLACGLYAALAAALANRTFVSGKNCFACNKLIDMSWKIISLGMRGGLSVVIGETWYLASQGAVCCSPYNIFELALRRCRCTPAATLRHSPRPRKVGQGRCLPDGMLAHTSSPSRNRR
jgi:hypothetical protein